MNDEEILQTLLEKALLFIIDFLLFVVSFVGFLFWFLERNTYALVKGISFGFVFVLFTIFMVISLVQLKKEEIKKDNGEIK